MEDVEAKAASEVAWFAAKVAVAAVAVIVFLAGWWWGVRNLEEAA